jgi:hypothetical protein
VPVPLLLARDSRRSIAEREEVVNRGSGGVACCSGGIVNRVLHFGQATSVLESEPSLMICELHFGHET